MIDRRLRAGREADTRPYNLGLITKGDIDGCTKAENRPRGETGVQADLREAAAVKELRGRRAEQPPRLKVSKSENGFKFDRTTP